MRSAGGQARHSNEKAGHPELFVRWLARPHRTKNSRQPVTFGPHYSKRCYDENVTGKNQRSRSFFVLSDCRWAHCHYKLMARPFLRVSEDSVFTRTEIPGVPREGETISF